MNLLVMALMGLLVFVHAGTAQQSTVSGKVRLADGWPVAGAQVTLFDLAALHQGAVARAISDESGFFALPLASLGRSALPQGFALGPNYPNPFNPSTVIPYQVPMATQVRLDVFNVLGQHIATLVDVEQPAGFHAAQWDATDAAGQAMAAGVYLYRLTVSGGQQTQRMVLVDGQAGIAAAPSASVAMATEAVEREYGLVVSGEGLTTYTDAAFGVRVGMAAVELVVDAAPLTSGNALAEDIWGDVNNDGQVSLEDAMLVVMSRSNPSIAMPNNGSIRLGDVNGDGAVNGPDVLVIMRYISNPLDGALPAGIGQRIASGKRVSDDSDVSRLTDLSARDRSPSWSPDGQHIAFMSVSESDNSEIYVMDLNGNNRRNLTNLSARDESPSWSPDGQHIAFMSVSESDNSEIYVMDLNGNNRRNLTNLSARDESPSWSPGGQHIAFESYRDGNDNSEIYVMGSDGSNPRRLTDHPALDRAPSWSPGGQHIAFESYRDGNDNSEIYVMGSDGSNPRRLTNHKAKDGSPSWSPDGQHITFSSDRDGNKEIYVMGSDGSNPRRLTNHKKSDVTPVWSPDGQRIAFSSDRDGNLGVYVIVYVMDGDGDGGTPSFEGATVANQTVAAGEVMTPLVLPMALGGDGELTYSLSLSPVVPGLTFDAATRTLSGTPTVAEDYALTYRVEDSDGDTDELTFTVTVDEEPMFADTDTVADQTVAAGEAMTPLVLPAGSGGDGELTYSLSPKVPGLTFDAATRTLSGTPTVAEDYALTYRVEDSDGDADELTFALKVDGLPSFEGTAELPGGASMEFVWIEPGVFQMGSKDRTGRKDEWPIHEVEISRGFWLGKYEITQSQWKSVMDTEPWSGRDRVEANSSHPAVIISWNEVQEFIGRLNAAAGEELYRLPTEAEWEYACRAGSTTRWSFGDDESQLRNYAWYFDNTEGAKAVGSKLPNPWGLYDMHGNVWEWVQDRYDEEYYSRSVREDPQGPESGLGRVIRGGHFGHIDGVRSAYRQFCPSGSRSYTIGVRLLRIPGN